MSSTTPEQLERLPKWAQQRIATLERDLAYTQAELAAGPEDSDTFADPYADSPRPLGEGTTVVFVLSRRDDGTPLEYVHVRTDAERRGTERGTKRVYIYGSDGHLVIYPQSSNTAFIKLGRP